MIKDSLIHESKLIDEKYAKLMKQWDGIDDVSHEINPSFEGIVRNPVLGRMIKKGSRRYKDIYLHMKRVVVALERNGIH